ncbi:MAG: rhodanese-like domain-containing protein [Phycisphaeraceae bacterium]|nr:rhodanese-like domain-containing protein [Phycisphaeraceae bacterium]
MRPTPSAPVILASFLALAGSCGCTQKTSDRDLQPVTPAEAVNLAAKGGGGLFSSDARAAWVDPRSPARFDTAHIPSAINLYFGSGDFENDSLVALKDRSPVIVYGTDYQDILADAASKRLIELGIKDVYTLRGGLLQWAKDGNDVDGTDPDSAAE